MPWLARSRISPEGATLIVDRYTFTVSYRGGDGNDVVLTVADVGPDVLTYYLAEGATGAFFDEDVLIANPNDSDAPVTLTFLLQEGGGTIIERRTVPKQGRLTVHVDQINELENASPSVQVTSDDKLPLIVERTMFWDARTTAATPRTPSRSRNGSGSSPRASRASSTPTC